MKLFLSVATVALAMAVLTAPATAQNQSQAFKGHLMDNACSMKHATEAGYAESHDKKCMLMPGCVKSGYGLVTADGKVLTFDTKGNDLALAFVKKTERDKNWTVTVHGTLSGTTIAVTSLELQ